MFSMYKRNSQIPIAKKWKLLNILKFMEKNKAAQYARFSLNVTLNIG